MDALRALSFRNSANLPVAAAEPDFGPYRLRTGDDAVWPPVERAYGGKVETLWRRWSWALVGLARLALPTALTVILMGAAFLYGDAVLPADSMPLLVRRALVTMGDLILPMSWISIHLTNRRYGPFHAMAQLGLALFVCYFVMLVNPYNIDAWLTVLPAPGIRAALSFGLAFAIANFIGVLVFDGARGPSWWKAPLIASLAVTLTYSAVFYPLAFAGAYDGWTESAWVHDVVFFAVSALLLVPYALLRPAMRPLEGLNGY